MDRISPEERRRNMQRIRSKNMKPEILVRRLLHRLGYRYRLHAKELPGKPDIVFRPRKKAIFVHGCFWHQHAKKSCLDGRMPKSNLDYWGPKLERNKARDRRNTTALKAQGWQVLVIWECECVDTGALAARLGKFLGPVRVL